MEDGFNFMWYGRRDFLQLCLFAGSAFSVLGCQEIAKSGGANILVVGAGVAGLAAARELKFKGFKVTVLEGRNRIGGRIFTDESIGLPVDLGASWIHGIDNNPIGKLARDSQIRILPTDYDNIQVYGNNGKLLGEKEIESADSLYQRVMKQAKAMSENLDRDISVAEAVKRIINQEKLSPQQQGILQWQLNSNILIENGTDLDRLSIWEWDEDEAFGGKDYLFPGGYDQIIQVLAKGIDVKLQQKVMAINYNDSGVVVKTDQGNFQGDAIVITLPLGVLKSASITFSPPLPSRKRAAINSLDMGVLNKVVLKFPNLFWSKDYDWIGYMSRMEKDFSDFLNLRRYSSAPVLIAFAGGSFAQSLEGISEKEVVERVMKVLRRVYGNSIPNPDAVLRTKWASDPFTLGSYSTMPVGSKGSDRTILAEPVGKRLFFAGEATSQDYPATVHGAFLSGIREAERIAKQF
jgi:polyamine oxidase